VNIWNSDFSLPECLSKKRVVFAGKSIKKGFISLITMGGGFPMVLCMHGLLTGGRHMLLVGGSDIFARRNSASMQTKRQIMHDLIFCN
jgi:hypothetical protein